MAKSLWLTCGKSCMGAVLDWGTSLWGAPASSPQPRCQGASPGQCLSPGPTSLAVLCPAVGGAGGGGPPLFVKTACGRNVVLGWPGSS